MDKINTRTSKVLVDGEFKDINPIEIQRGMIFKIFESDGKEVCGLKGNTFKAIGNAYYNDNGVIHIETEDYEDIQSTMEDIKNGLPKYCKKCNQEIDLYKYLAHNGYCGSQCFLMTE